MDPWNTNVESGMYHTAEYVCVPKLPFFALAGNILKTVWNETATRDKVRAVREE